MIKIIKKIIRRFYRKFYYYQTKLENNYQKSKKVYPITSELVDKIKSQYPDEFTDRKYNIFKERVLSLNNFGYVVVINQQIAAYAWIGIDEFYEGSSGFSETLSKDTVYLFDIYTFEKFRKQGLMKILMETLFKEFETKGYTYIRTIVANDNIRSKNLMQNFNFQAFAQLSVKYLGRRKFIKYKKL